MVLICIFLTTGDAEHLFPIRDTMELFTKVEQRNPKIYTEQHKIA